MKKQSYYGAWRHSLFPLHLHKLMKPGSHVRYPMC